MASPALLLLVAAIAAPRIVVTPIGDAQWRLTISVAGPEIDTAQAKLGARARLLCRGKTPTFGKYKFAATAPLTGPASDRPRTLTLTQEVACGTASPAPTPTVAAAVAAPAVDASAAGLAFARRYLDARESGDRATLRASVNAEAMNLSDMLHGLAAERAKLGPPVGKRRYKVTVYRDPPNAPRPGVYIAIDYALAYRNAPSVCGYVIVHESPGGAMAVTREERAVIDATSAAKMTPDELTAIRERFRCNVP